MKIKTTTNDHHQLQRSDTYQTKKQHHPNDKQPTNQHQHTHPSPNNHKQLNHVKFPISYQLTLTDIDGLSYYDDYRTEQGLKTY